jgi:predicted DNA-binding protein
MSRREVRFEMRMSDEERRKLKLLSDKYGMTESKVLRGLILRQVHLLRLEEHNKALCTYKKD